ncbi:MAG TPA: phosphotransferase [Propionibacteriaceae bacterium]|nr:phosphotransferase [Propionibacteriaceae bacterium]
MLSDYAEPIAEAYDLGAVTEFAGPVARGEQGEVWRLDTDRGTWAVKRSYFEFPDADAQRAGEFQNLARAHGVPAPAAVTTRAGRYGHDVAGTLVRVQSWVEVLEPSSMIDPARVGATVAALHRTVLPPDAGPHPWYTDAIGADGWDELLAEARRQRAPFADRLASLRDELIALEALLTPMTPIQTCHLDLWYDNLRATPGGDLCLLDWDNCGPGDPSREVALVLFDFARTSPERMTALYGAYCDVGGPGRVRTTADFSLLIAQLGHIGAMQMRRWLDPATSEAERAYTLRSIAEFLEDSLERATIESILAVVT